MAEKISVQIGLEGADEVKKQLTEIGEAATNAFANLNQAASRPAEGIAKTGEASQTTAGQLTKVSQSADKAGQSFDQVAQESLKTATAVADLTGTIAEHAIKIGLAVQSHRGLISSFLSMAGGANTAVRALGLLSPQFALLGTGFGGVALGVAKAVVAFEALERVATKIAASTEKLNNTLQTLAATSGKSFDELQRGEAAFNQIGISAETFRGSVAKINETLAGTEVKNLTKGMQDIVALTMEIAAGQKGIKFADWVTAEDKVKGVAIAMKQAADQGKNATQVLLEFIRNADLASAIKVGAAFGLSEADVDRVRRLGENISDLTQRIAGAPPLISPASAAAFDAMRTSLQNVDSAMARLKQSINTTDFSAMAAGLSATMNTMKAAAINGAASISEALGQAFRGMSSQAASDVSAIGAALKDIGVTDVLKQFVTNFNQDLAGANAALANFVGNFLRSMGGSAEQIKIVEDSIKGIAPAVQTAGQAAQQSGVMFTSWGTLAQQGANTAKAAAQEAAVMFTSFGTIANQSAAKADASMRQAAGGITATGDAAQSGSDKVAAFVSHMTGIAWDAISGAGVAAWNALTGAIGPAVTGVGEFVSKMATIAWDAISGAGVAAWNALTGAIQSAIDKLLTFTGLKPTTPDTGGGAPGKARGGLLGGRGTGTSDSNLAWLSRGEYIMPASAVRQPGVLAFLEALRRSGRIPGFAKGGPVGSGPGIGAFASGLSGVIQGLYGASQAAFSNSVRITESLKTLAFAILQQADAWFDTLDGISLAVFENSNQVVDAFTRAIRALEGILRAAESAQGKARGGLLGGRGTGTSDSNLAWVSRGEHIMPARAVRQPGVLAFLEMLRMSGGDLRRVLDGMGRFALGGMVPRAIPAFATGGLAGGNNVTIQFPGLPEIGGLRASSGAVDELQRAAALAQVRSGGRKPSRYS